MNQNPFHAKRIGDGTGVLAAGAAETGKRITRDIMAARDRDLADCGGHVVDCNFNESCGDPLERARAAKRVGDLLQPCARGVGIERLLSVHPEHGREMVGRDLAEEQVAVGNRQRPPISITCRARVGPGRFRANAEAHSVKAAD